jgi:hypothetical protein
MENNVIYSKLIPERLHSMKQPSLMANANDATIRNVNHESITSVNHWIVKQIRNVDPWKLVVMPVIINLTIKLSSFMYETSHSGNQIASYWRCLVNLWNKIVVFHV